MLRWIDAGDDPTHYFLQLEEQYDQEIMYGLLGYIGCLVLAIISGCVCDRRSRSGSDDYIPVHSREQLRDPLNPYSRTPVTDLQRGYIRNKYGERGQ